MHPEDEIELLLTYLQHARDALLWKLDGLGEYDIRRPLTPTGTNLLGLLKHTASVEYGYLTECFGRNAGIDTPWLDEDAPENADLWAEVHETRESIVELARAAWAADDVSARALGPDAIGAVPWWGERGKAVTMRRLLVHAIAETHRHAGHADILRETIDGAAGMRATAANLPDHDAEWWARYVETLEDAAREAARSEDALQDGAGGASRA